MLLYGQLLVVRDETDELRLNSWGDEWTSMGLGLQPHFLQMARACFPDELQLLDLSGCPGVWGGRVLGLLGNTRIGQRPKEERLDKLGLAGCNVRPSHVPGLDRFVRHNRSSPSAREGFDFWVCSLAVKPHVVETCCHCGVCGMFGCKDCVVKETVGALLPATLARVCRFCDAFLCEGCYFDGSDPLILCGWCGESLCVGCRDNRGKGIVCVICDTTLCSYCQEREETRSFETCSFLDGKMCEDCTQELAMAASRSLML